MQSDYKVCPKCGVRYSTLTRHRCIKVEMNKPPKFDDPKHDEFEHDGQGGGDTESHDEHGGSDGQGKDGQGKDKSDQQGKGEGQGGGDQQGDDDQQGGGDQQGEDGEDEQEGEGEGEGPTPQAPDPEIPPVAVVCTVLKFAALTAACAKNGNIEITLAEDGLYVYGHNGDLWGHDTIPWGEFEKRSTLDGEFYVKEIIDGVDAKLAPPKPELPEATQEEEEVKPKRKRKASKGKSEAAGGPTLPLTIGQRIVMEDGRVAIVERFCGWKDKHGDGGDGVECRYIGSGETTVLWSKLGRSNLMPDIPQIRAVRDAKLTLPLTAGQRVLREDGHVVTVAKVKPKGGGSDPVPEGDQAEYDDGYATDATTGDAKIWGGGRFSAIADAE